MLLHEVAHHPETEESDHHQARHEQPAVIHRGSVVNVLNQICRVHIRNCATTRCTRSITSRRVRKNSAAFCAEKKVASPGVLTQSTRLVLRSITGANRTTASSC